VLAAAGAVVVVFCSFLGYAAVEVAYRAYQYYAVRAALVAAAAARFSADGTGVSIFDERTGYRYRPNLDFQPENSPFPVHYRTNAHGLIAREDYPVQKPAGEFRIGLIGDSFTANVTNSVRWGDVLEDRLNASPRWREAVGDRRTRVVNFGLDGIGVVQFDDVAATMTMPFGIDLLVVNMIRSDVARRPYFRGRRESVSQADITNWVERNALSQMSWLSPYPEVLAVVSGRLFRLAPRLTVERAGALLMGERHYANVEDAGEQSAQAAREVMRLYPGAVWLVHPAMWDYTAEEDTLFRMSYEAFVRRVPEIALVDMMPRLPTPRSRDELNSWFNVPHDLHNSDLGLRIYGEAVALYLIETLPVVRRSAAH
jgi:hypothetical protein